MKRSKTIRKFILTLILLGLVLPAIGVSAKKYYIDQQSVVLYKIINWWHDCLPNECDLFCGEKISCTDKGNVSIEKPNLTETLVLHITGNFADMLLPFKRTDASFGPTRFRCSQLNNKYFGDGVAEDIHPPRNGIFELRIRTVSEDRIRIIKRIEKDIRVAMEGVVGGLATSRIALHQAGLMRNHCNQDNDNANKESNFPIKLILVDAHTNEIMIEYAAVWE